MADMRSAHPKPNKRAHPQLGERIIKRALIHEINNWTPQQAAEWSGIKYRTLLRLLKEGLVPAIPVGPEQRQKMGNGKRRRRACAMYLIPRVAFQKWFENIGAPGNTAA
jgi:hypothetical protein